MGKVGLMEPSPLTFPAGPGLSLTPTWGGYATSGPASIAQDASWLTMAYVPQCVLPALGPLASELWRPECRQWEPQISFSC